MGHWKSLLAGLLALRERLKAGDLYNYHAGICGNLVRTGLVGDVPDEVLAEMFRAWPKFSGDIDFPVPGGCREYSRARINKTMWEGDYGELRMELLNFCIEKLQTELKQPTTSEEGDE